MSPSPHIPRDYKNLNVRRRPSPNPAWVRAGAVALSRGYRRLESLVSRRALALATGAGASVLLLGWALAGDPPPPAEPIQQTEPLPLPAPTVGPPSEPEPELIAEVPPETPWRVETVRKGDTLASMFKRLGLGPRSVHRVVHLNEHTRRLTTLYPGDELKFQLAADGALKALEYQLDEATRLRLEQTDEGLGARLLEDELIAQPERASGVIRDSLFVAGRKAGLSDKLIMEMAGLFGWDIDFVLDIRSGDEFHLVYERVYRNGEYLRAGDILAATFVNQGRKYQALRYDPGDGAEYFSPDGRNMKKAFLRAPLNFSYISSNFNPRRFHPILRRVRAHNGVDYRAPSGTPVYAAGNGTVTRSGYGQNNGHHVFIQHGNGIVTKYLHFSKRTVKKGDRVKQGQVIGYVGATGLAEAPHLHYEFLVNGVHRNPRTVDLPKAEALPPERMADFNDQVRPLLAQLDQLQQGRLLAQAAAGSPALGK